MNQQGLTHEGWELALVQYDHVEQQSSLAATKATILVAVQAIVGGTYVTLAKDCSVFTSFQSKPLAFFEFSLAGILLMAGLIAALAAIFPKHRPDDKSDVLFFAAIRLHCCSEHYWKKYLEKDDAGLLGRDLIENIYGKSKWLAKNFLWIKTSILLLIMATLFAVWSIFFEGSFKDLQCKPDSGTPIAAVVSK
jgi:hypothetical protein